jgi:2-methylcitrate dehydratase PrpD
MSDAFDHIFDFARELTADRLPAPVMHQARRCLVDLLGVWAAGAATRPARMRAIMPPGATERPRSRLRCCSTGGP